MRNFKHSLMADMALQERLLVQYENELRRLPKGTLKPSCSGKVVHYVDEGGNEFGTEQTAQVAAGVSRRQLLEKKTKWIRQNLKRQRKLLAQYRSYTDESVLAKIGSVYGRILLGEKAEANQMGQTADSGTMVSQFEKAGHKSLEGVEMDSKSEVIISMLLDAYGVKYTRGEAIVWPYGMSAEAEQSRMELQLPGVVVPDFVFVLPSGEKIYWEHLGMLGKKEYSLRWMRKQVFYHWMGITQGVNLIVTADACNGVIDPAAIAEIIETKLAPLITKPRRH